MLRIVKQTRPDRENDSGLGACGPVENMNLTWTVRKLDFSISDFSKLTFTGLPRNNGTQSAISLREKNITEKTISRIVINNMRASKWQADQGVR